MQSMSQTSEADQELSLVETGYDTRHRVNRLRRQRNEAREECKRMEEEKERIEREIEELRRRLRLRPETDDVEDSYSDSDEEDQIPANRAMPNNIAQ